MKVIVTNSYDETCAVIANMIKELVNAKPDAKLGLATGGTPVPIYKKLIEMNKAGEVDFSRVHTVNLDEYCGIPGTHDQSYRYFMDTNLFDHINIDKKNTFVASGMGDFEAANATRCASTPTSARAARRICSCWASATTATSHSTRPATTSSPWPTPKS